MIGKKAGLMFVGGALMLVGAAVDVAETERAFRALPLDVWHVLSSKANAVLLGLAALWYGFRLRARATRAPAVMTPADSPMAGVREGIDDLDVQLVALLAHRQRKIEAAAQVKRANGIPALVPERVDEVLRNVDARAQAENLDGALAKSLWTTIIDWSIAYEERLMKQAAEKDRA